MTTTVSTDIGEVTIRVYKDTLEIVLDKDAVNCSSIVCLSSGSPGIIGPDLEFVVRDIVKTKVDEATEEAYAYPYAL